MVKETTSDWLDRHAIQLGVCVSRVVYWKGKHVVRHSLLSTYLLQEMDQVLSLDRWSSGRQSLC